MKLRGSLLVMVTFVIKLKKNLLKICLAFQGVLFLLYPLVGHLKS